MFKRIVSYLKESKDRKNKKIEIESKIELLEEKKDKCFSQWCEMLVDIDKIIIIKSQTKEEFEKKYAEIINDLKKRKPIEEAIGLGNVTCMSEDGLDYKEGYFIKCIKYKEYLLKEGIDISKYTKSRNEYDEAINEMERLWDELETL